MNNTESEVTIPASIAHKISYLQRAYAGMGIAADKETKELYKVIADELEVVESLENDILKDRLSNSERELIYYKKARYLDGLWKGIFFSTIVYIVTISLIMLALYYIL